ncbi:hypothetical protein ABW19_dt0201386 [Dactylella cylindrospora]|nr:hypothetical protein ABW19_dt0201386 [Dactylella cylindrospora]
MLSYTGSCHHSWRRTVHHTALKVAAVIVIIFIFLFSNVTEHARLPEPTPPVTQEHPINNLAQLQRRSYQKFLSRQSKSPEEAAKNYRLRYGRDPPVGFLDWARYALDQNSAVIDDFDTIEKVLKPFRSLTPLQLQTRIESARRRGSRLQTVSIRNGSPSVTGLPITDSLKPVLKYIPDISFLLNELDEPRVLGNRTDKDVIAFRDFGRQPAWERLTESCGPIRNDGHPFYLESVADSLDLCKNPTYWDQYGMFTSPCTFVATPGLVPIFSVARVSTMRDILVPGHDYHAERFLDENDADTRNFTLKVNKLYWRGSNTGTYATSRMRWETNHRARFMLRVRNNTALFDVGMTAYIQCDWEMCQAMENTFGKPPRAEKNDSFNYKFVMDMDGNGYSGRFYRLMLSNSVVFKQTLVEQWHDDRLFPWVHYVPVTISLDEIEELVTFFTTQGASLAETIAAESTSWVRTALRPVDMTIYEYRLLLEYAELFRNKD